MDSNKDATQHFEFGTRGVAQQRRPSRSIQAEVSGKGIMDQEAVVTAFEMQQGIRPRGKAPKQEDNMHYTSVILKPERDDHRIELDKLVNNPEYKIVVWKDTFTATGEYKVFIMYGKEKEKAKDE